MVKFSLPGRGESAALVALGAGRGNDARSFYHQEARIRRALVVRILSVVTAAIRAHDTCKRVLRRRPGRQSDNPIELARVELLQKASMTLRREEAPYAPDPYVHA